MRVQKGLPLAPSQATICSAEGLVIAPLVIQLPMAAVSSLATFKPTSTIGRDQKTVTASHEETTLAARGRHDPCVLPRAVPIVEAMAALVLVDHALRQRAISNVGFRKPDESISDCGDRISER